MHACTCFITSVFVYVYMGLIFECIYLGNCVYKRACMSIHILFWLYYISCIYRKRKKLKKKKEVKDWALYRMAKCNIQQWKIMF